MTNTKCPFCQNYSLDVLSYDGVIEDEYRYLQEGDNATLFCNVDYGDGCFTQDIVVTQLVAVEY